MTIKMLVAFDGSELSKQALAEVRNQAVNAEDKEVHIVQVASPAGPSTFAAVSREISKEMAETLEGDMEEVKKELVEEDYRVITKVIAGKDNPGIAICEYAEEQDMDLIIIGNRKLGNVKRLFLGSVSNNVVQNAPCPVLVMK